MEQNFDIEAKVLSLGAYLISGIAAVRRLAASRLVGVNGAPVVNCRRSVIPQDASSEIP